MRLREYFMAFDSNGGAVWLPQFAFGLLLMLVGLTILLFPRILVAMISGTIMLIGAGVAVAAWRFRPRGTPQDDITTHFRDT